MFYKKRHRRKCEKMIPLRLPGFCLWCGKYYYWTKKNKCLYHCYWCGKSVPRNKKKRLPYCSRKCSESAKQKNEIDFWHWFYNSPHGCKNPIHLGAIGLYACLQESDEKDRHRKYILVRFPLEWDIKKEQRKWLSRVTRCYKDRVEGIGVTKNGRIKAICNKNIYKEKWGKESEVNAICKKRNLWIIKEFHKLSKQFNKLECYAKIEDGLENMWKNKDFRFGITDKLLLLRENEDILLSERINQNPEDIKRIPYLLTTDAIRKIIHSKL